jgi:mannan endo-1,4-beta-mannosidase
MLYRLMYDRFTKTHELNNLVWVRNSGSPDWYSGNDAVDILSYPAQLTLPITCHPIALAEVGEIPDLNQLRACYADWAYFVTCLLHALVCYMVPM